MFNEPQVLDPGGERRYISTANWHVYCLNAISSSILVGPAWRALVVQVKFRLRSLDLQQKSDLQRDLRVLPKLSSRQDQDVMNPNFLLVGVVAHGLSYEISKT